MRVVFRVDASIEIGTGHVMRCLTLADALHARGDECSFICRVHEGNLIELIRTRGYNVYLLPVVASNQKACSPVEGYAAWLGADWETDAKQTLLALADVDIDWLVVDHYALDAHWEKQLKSVCSHLMVIDDLANRHHDCNLLLDQNLNRNSEEYFGLVSIDCELLIGPKYALLKPEFSELREYSYARRTQPKLKRVLISMGGVDKDNKTGSLLSAISHCNLLEGCQIIVVMGEYAPWLQDVRAQVSRLPTVEVLVNVQNMAKLMSDCDLAIGAAGTTAWERCCLALPTIAMVLAENQRAGADALLKAGAVLMMDGEKLHLDELEAKIDALLLPQQLQKMQDVAYAICDGMGVFRVTEKIVHVN